MEVRNCPGCGKLYAYTGQRLCPNCFKEETKLFEQVDEYLREHPGANLEAVAEGTGIAKEIILDFIRRGRLVTLTANNQFRCAICGQPINRGRICEDCAAQLRGGLTGKKAPRQRRPEESKSSDQRMHIADLLEKRGRLRR